MVWGWGNLTDERYPKVTRAQLIYTQNGATSGFEMCFGPSTLGDLGCWGQNTSRIQRKEVSTASNYAVVFFPGHRRPARHKRLNTDTRTHGHTGTQHTTRTHNTDTHHGHTHHGHTTRTHNTVTRPHNTATQHGHTTHDTRCTATCRSLQHLPYQTLPATLSFYPSHVHQHTSDLQLCFIIFWLVVKDSDNVTIQ